MSVQAPSLQRLKARNPGPCPSRGPVGTLRPPGLLPRGGQQVGPGSSPCPSLSQAADKGSRKRYEPSDKDRPSPPPAKRANLSPDRGEPQALQGPVRPGGLERYPQEPIVWVRLSVSDVLELKLRRRLQRVFMLK